MKYLLLITLLCYGLTYGACKAANQAGDNFGAAGPALIGIAASIVLTLIYVGLAFWYHKFW